MSGPGRNAPCHCGSGRKYKKCCLRRDEAADREGRAAGAATARADRELDRVAGAVHELVESALRVERNVTTMALASLLSQLGLRPEAFHDEELRSQICLLLVFCHPPLTEQHGEYQQALARTLVGDRWAWLIDRVRSGRLGLWEILGPGPGPGPNDTKVRDMVEERAAPEVVNGIVAASYDAIEDCTLGWVFDSGGFRILLELSNPFWEDAYDTATAAAEQRRTEPGADWRMDLLCDCLTSEILPALEPLGFEPPGRGLRDPTAVDQWTLHWVAAGVRRELEHVLLHGLGRPLELEHPDLGTLAFCRPRVLFAVAETDEMRRRVMATLEQLRRTAFVEHLGRRSLPPEALENVPLSMLLEQANVSEKQLDGLAVAADPSALPLGLLLLRDDHPLFGRHDPSEPVAVAMGWAERTADASAAAEVRRACAHLRLERRLERLVDGGVAWRVVDDRVEALTSGLYAAELSARSLEELDMPRASRGRVVRAMEKLAGRDLPEPRVADLPAPTKLYRSGLGVGPKTWRDLIGAIDAHTAGWRERAAGDAARRPQKVKGEAGQMLGEGLDELAALFGDAPA